MLILYTREKHSFQLIAEIFVIVTYPHNAVLNDVRHKRSMFMVIWNSPSKQHATQDLQSPSLEEGDFGKVEKPWQ